MLPETVQAQLSWLDKFMLSGEQYRSLYGHKYARPTPPSFAVNSPSMSESARREVTETSQPFVELPDKLHKRWHRALWVLATSKV